MYIYLLLLLLLSYDMLPGAILPAGPHAVLRPGRQDAHGDQGVSGAVCVILEGNHIDRVVLQRLKSPPVGFPGLGFDRLLDFVSGDLYVSLVSRLWGGNTDPFYGWTGILPGLIQSLR